MSWEWATKVGMVVISVQVAGWCWWLQQQQGRQQQQQQQQQQQRQRVCMRAAVSARQRTFRIARLHINSALTAIHNIVPKFRHEVYRLRRNMIRNRPVAEERCGWGWGADGGPTNQLTN